MKFKILFFYSFLVFSHSCFSEESRRIIGGRDAPIGVWSGMVSINKSFGVYCGGSLITPHWVLSAAHCFDNSSNSHQEFTLYLNFTDQFNTNRAEQRSIAEVFVHPQWDTFNRDSPYDIALIRLNKASQQVPFYPDIAANSYVKTGLLTKALGWGVTNINSFSSSRFLQYVNLPIVTNTLCQAAYQNTYTLFDGQICAGFEAGGKDSCSGDSGAPLIYHDGIDWRLLGIASFGGTNQIPCGGAGLYGIYSHVNYYKAFIRQHIYQQIRFKHQTVFNTNELLNIAVEQTTVNPRLNVDLWVMVENIDTKAAYFITGTANQAHFQTEPIAWQTDIKPEQNTHQLLNMIISTAIIGNYRLYALYIDTGKPLDTRYQRSDIATSQFQIIN